MSNKRGAFIVLEGCDRAGKSTQVKLVTEQLKKQEMLVESLAFPNRSSTSGQKINRYLKGIENISDRDIHVLFSDNRREIAPSMIKKINDGVTLIVDRYSYSGVAFSAAKPNMCEEWCWKQERGLPKPDVVLFLQLPLDKAAKRDGYGGEQYENFEFQSKVYKNYQNMMDNSWKIINADADIQTVTNNILEIIKNTIANVGDKPLTEF